MKAPGIAGYIPGNLLNKSLLQNYKYFIVIYDYNMLYFLCL